MLKSDTHSGEVQKRVTDWITAGATIVAAASLVIAVWTYLEQERSARLQRTLTFLTDANQEWESDDRTILLTEFSGRWSSTIVPLTAEDAQSFFEISGKPKKGDTLSDKWNVARRHLNELEPVAFGYVHDLGDREILAAAMCLNMSRSSEYFKALIDRFAKEFPGHTWQIIPQAVRLMEEQWGPRCNRLGPPAAK